MADKPHSAFRPLWFLFALLVAMSAITAISRLRTPPEVVPWRTDVTAATEGAHRDGKPTLLYFTATWCGPCQNMKRDTWSDASVAAKLRGYVPVKVDVDQNAEFAQRYNVDSMPTFVVLDKDGKTVKRTSGYMGPVDFIAWIDG